jgi:hypothetical protein
LTTTKSSISVGAEPADLPPSPPARPGLHWRRRIASLSRWLHTYLSMFSFMILLFFALTGFTLNHADWFAGESSTSKYQGALDRAWMGATGSKDVAKLEIVEYLRRVHGIRSAVSDFQVDDEQCEISFKGPGYEAGAIVDRETGKYELSVTHSGFVAVVNDLHKGRDTGTKWSGIIDFSAILMTLVSLTGLTLIFFLTKRRVSGLVLFAMGALFFYLVYAVLVP